MKGLDWSAHSPEPQPRPTPFGWGRSADSEPEFSFRPHITAARHINIWRTDSNQSNVREWSSNSTGYFVPAWFSCLLALSDLLHMSRVCGNCKCRVTNSGERLLPHPPLLQQTVVYCSSGWTQFHQPTCHPALRKKKQKTSQILVPVALLRHKNKQRNTSVSVRRPSMIF